MDGAGGFSLWVSGFVVTLTTRWIQEALNLRDWLYEVRGDEAHLALDKDIKVLYKSYGLNWIFCPGPIFVMEKW
jgi:hypothetical protein